MTVINTTSGRIRGEVVDGIHRFQAVPYAAAPEGELRFAAPQPSTWDGERDATKPGPIAPQVSRTMGTLNLSALVSADRPQGGEYLTVNVHTPDPAAGSLPVMVFIHGGAFIAGTGSAVLYDGRGFARAGVVLVTINYRLGIDGFLSLDGVSNLGLRDQLAALTWVRDNAAAFGGDPDNVTVFGESAGGSSVACLLGSPLARGLFRRAIVESGHSDMVRDEGRARRIAEHIADKLGVPATAAAFREIGTDKLLATQAEVSTPGNLPDLRDEHGVDPLYGLTPFAPVIGDDVLPTQPRESLDAGVELLAGYNAEEMKLYLVPTGVLGAATDELVLALLGASRPDAADVLKGYGLGQDPAGEVLSRTLTDLVFADGVRRLLAEHPGRAFGYRFEWRSPQYDGQLGACHGLELPFVFDTLAAAETLVGPDAPQRLATEMHGTWVRFAKTGDPGWAAGAVRSFA